MLKPLLFTAPLAAALAVALPAQAQQPSAYQSADAIVFTANSVLVALDQGKAINVFNATPVFVRQQVTQPDFINGLTSERARLPAELQREWVSVERVVLTLNTTRQVVPCANVVYRAQGLRAPVHERVSLCWQDNHWLPTGYSVLVGQAAPAQPPAPTPAPPAPAAPGRR